MTLEIAFVLFVGLCALALFVTEKLRVDVVALLVMVTFISTGVISPEQGISGFSNPATVTVAAMFVLAAGLQRTGALDFAAELVMRLAGDSTWRTAAVLMMSVAFLSGFINNTAAVAVFLPVTIELARRTGTSPSKLLIPLSFASLFGGVCTLIGTSTNVLVSTLSVQHGDKPLGMFEIAPLGIIMVMIGIFYMLLIGIRLLPDHRQPQSLEEEFDIGPYLTEIRLRKDCASLGLSLLEAPLTRGLDVDVLEIQRDQTLIQHIDSHTRLQVEDLLRIRCSLETLNILRTLPGVEIHPLGGGPSNVHFLEAVVAPGSVLNGQTLKTIDFREKFKCTALALRRHGETLHTKLGDIALQTGDVLVLAETPESLLKLQKSRDFVVVSKVVMSRSRRHLALPSVLILALVVTTVAFEFLPVVVAAMLGCAGLLLVGCLTPDEVYESIDWSVVMMLGGMLTLGTAIHESAADQLLGDALLSVAGAFGPWFLLSTFYLMTSLLTEVLSNSATAVLLVPIAFSSAAGLGVDPRPFLIAITFAASASFMTPIGYQTNALVYGPGGYRFSDYLKVGTPLNLIFWIIASFLIPVFWPFHKV
jgi:di/tricarboxylate transporter